MIRVGVFSSEKKFRKFEKGIRQTAVQALKILKKDGVSVEIFLLGKEKMRADVLSFNEPESWPRLGKIKPLGEIHLNADKSNWSNRAYRTDLLVHGLLHLLGYDHKKKSDTIKMNYVFNRLRHRLG